MKAVQQGKMLSLAFLCCLPAACLERKISSWNRITASGDQPRDRQLCLKEDGEDPGQVALGGQDNLTDHRPIESKNH